MVFVKFRENASIKRGVNGGVLEVYRAVFRMRRGVLYEGAYRRRNDRPSIEGERVALCFRNEERELLAPVCL